MAKQSHPSSWLARGRTLLPARGTLRFGLRPRTTAIDVDGQVLRVVQTVYRYGRTRVTRFAADKIDLPSDTEPADAKVLGLAIAQAFQRMRWKPSRVVMGVPRALVVLRTIALPDSKNDGELASMVHFQIAKDLPFPIEEAIIDFKVQSPLLPSPGETALFKPGTHKDSLGEASEAQPKVQILVAAVQRDVVEYYKLAAATAGFTLAALGLRSYANVRCVEACQLTKPEETVALVSLRPDEVIIDVLDGRHLAFSRVAPVAQPGDGELESVSEESELPQSHAPEAAAQEGASPEAPLEIAKSTDLVRFAQAVTIEVVRSLHSYQGTAQRSPVSRVVVAGGTGQERDVVQALQNRLSIPASLLDPASALGLPESVSQHAAGALAVFGLGIGVNDREGLPFDFLRPKQPTAPPQPRRVKLLGAAAAAAALLLILIAVRTFLVQDRLQLQRALSEELAKQKQNRPTYQRMRLQTESLIEWTKESRNWLGYYAALSTNLPPRKEIYLSSLSLGGQDTIRMSVLAKSGEILAKLESQLSEAGYRVKPLAITPGSDKAGYNFKSTVELILPSALPTPSPQSLATNATATTPAPATP